MSNKLEGGLGLTGNYQQGENNWTESMNENLELINNSINSLSQQLQAIITDLQNSGAWDNVNQRLVQGRSIATGNINLFAGTVDGESFIRTNNGQTENDIAAGLITE